MFIEQFNWVYTIILVISNAKKGKTHSLCDFVIYFFLRKTLPYLVLSGTKYAKFQIPLWFIYFFLSEFIKTLNKKSPYSSNSSFPLMSRMVERSAGSNAIGSRFLAVPSDLTALGAACDKTWHGDQWRKPTWRWMMREH